MTKKKFKSTKKNTKSPLLYSDNYFMFLQLSWPSVSSVFPRFMEMATFHFPFNPLTFPALPFQCHIYFSFPMSHLIFLSHLILLFQCHICFSFPMSHFFFLSNVTFVFPFQCHNWFSFPNSHLFFLSNVTITFYFPMSNLFFLFSKSHLLFIFSDLFISCPLSHI